MLECFVLCSSPKYFHVVLRCVMEMRELTVLAGSFVGFQLLFTAVSPRLSSSITPGYTQLPSTKVTEWNSRCVTLEPAFLHRNWQNNVGFGFKCDLNYMNPSVAIWWVQNEVKSSSHMNIQQWNNTISKYFWFHLT